ncbi:MAG: AAA family ATPase, partial [Pseudohongiellaceae bacterium]
MSTRQPDSIEAVTELLHSQGYLADRALATTVFLALKMQRPLFLEGEPGVGKTELARALAAGLDRPVLRLQCYEGLDIAGAVYEWNYARQMIEIRLAEAAGATAAANREALARDVFSEQFLVARPLLQALQGQPGKAPVLLIDELDR